MAIGFRAAGTDTSGTTDPTAALPLPVGWAASDMHVLVFQLKSTVVVNTPTGWTAGTNSNVTGGAGTTGIDAGTNRVVVFYREAQAGDTDQVVDLGSVPNVWQGRILGFTKAAGESWDALVFSSGADTTGSTTDYSATGNVTIDLASGDWIGQATGFNGDAGTPGSRTLAVPGVTLGAYAAHSSDVATTAGGDLRSDAGTAPYSSGTASGAPSYSRAWASGNASFAGATVFFRLRVTTAPSGPLTVPARQYTTLLPAVVRASRW